MGCFECTAVVYESDPMSGEAYNMVHRLVVEAGSYREAVDKVKRKIREFYSQSPCIEYYIGKIRCRKVNRL